MFLFKMSMTWGKSSNDAIARELQNDYDLIKDWEDWEKEEAN